MGTPGWIGLECVRERDGVEAWLALRERGSDSVIESLGGLDAPAESLAAAGGAAWVRDYAPLATLSWAASVGTAAAARAAGLVTREVREGTPLTEALRQAAGTEAAEALLGAPLAADIALVRGERRLAVEGERWSWVEGGWRPASGPVHATQRFDREDGAPGPRIGPAPPGDRTGGRGLHPARRLARVRAHPRRQRLARRALKMALPTGSGPSSTPARRTRRWPRLPVPRRRRSRR